MKQPEAIHRSWSLLYTYGNFCTLWALLNSEALGLCRSQFVPSLTAEPFHIWSAFTVDFIRSKEQAKEFLTDIFAVISIKCATQMKLHTFSVQCVVLCLSVIFSAAYHLKFEIGWRKIVVSREKMTETFWNQFLRWTDFVLLLSRIIFLLYE